MTIAIITEAGARKVAPLVIVAQQAAAIATQMAGIASAIAAERYYPDYATGNAATTAGQYFAVIGSGSYDFYIHGTATPVVELPVLDGSGNLGVAGNIVLSPGVDRIVRLGSESNFWYDLRTRLDDFRIVAADGTICLNILYPSYSLNPGVDAVASLGAAVARWDDIYLANSPTVTSDERGKANIEAIPDEWLDAWATVEWVRYKAHGGSRWHVGLIAQRVHAAFAAHDIDAFEIGLCCFDEWEVHGDVPAGNRWGLRYTECEAMEAAYQRREIGRLKAQVAAL